MLKPETSSTQRPLVPFFVLVFVLTAPFWLLGAIHDVQLLPGLPLAGLAVICPTLAALVLVIRQSGLNGARELLSRVADFRRIGSPLWYLPILLIPPGIAVLAFFVQRSFGIPIPAPDVSLASILLLILMFLPAAAMEELGWSGYATEPLQKRFGELGAGLVLGGVWSAWHLPALIQAHRAPDWIAWWCLGTIAARVISVWLFNRTGQSVFAVTLYHAASNLSWQLFPVQGSYFDPRINGLITVVLAVALALWGGATRRVG